MDSFKYLLGTDIERIKLSIKKGSQNVWEEGITLKGFGLCHGITGNWYVFAYITKSQQMPD